MWSDVGYGLIVQQEKHKKKYETLHIESIQQIYNTCKITNTSNVAI